MSPALVFLLIGLGCFVIATLAWLAFTRLATTCPYGCDLCVAEEAARRRREREQQLELRHDYAHRTWGQCGDPTCPRKK